MSHARFFVRTNIHPAATGTAIYEDYVNCKCCDFVDFLPEPDGTILNAKIPYSCDSDYVWGLEDMTIDELKIWLGNLKNIIASHSDSVFSPRGNLADFFKWPDRHLFGPGLCKKVHGELVAWLPIIQAETDPDFFSIYRYFKEIFESAGKNGIFGVEAWDRPTCNNLNRVVFENDI